MKFVWDCRLLVGDMEEMKSLVVIEHGGIGLSVRNLGFITFIKVKQLAFCT